MTFLMSAHDTLTRMDWLHASWLVSDAAAPLMAVFNLVLSGWARIAELPIVGAGLAYAFVPLLTALMVVLALSGALLVVLVLLGSALLSGAIEIVLGSGAQLLDGITQLMRLIRGA